MGANFEGWGQLVGPSLHTTWKGTTSGPAWHIRYERGCWQEVRLCRHNHTREDSHDITQAMFTIDTKSLAHTWVARGYNNPICKSLKWEDPIYSLHCTVRGINQRPLCATFVAHAFDTLHLQNWFMRKPGRRIAGRLGTPNPTKILKVCVCAWVDPPNDWRPLWLS